MKLPNTALAIVVSMALPAALTAQDAAEQQQQEPVVGSIYSEAASSTHVASKEEITAGSNKEKVICRRDKVIGSRVKAERVCKTAKEWEWEKKANREMVERGQNQRTTSVGG
ncbi:hypothetical protein [Qipengyuania qiaonensis]|uniref:Secreted protein n=1 Tax=Qipengyuania qiaonensis TaxID=2867240 RepID=A0ABS7J8G2_9SPHN|nr:hypothetical protein [Qipengyuania qiaonensis]MBX7483228.1 hypothetical protein [Qipengyuania qiaonensis]